MLLLANLIKIKFLLVIQNWDILAYAPNHNVIIISCLIQSNMVIMT